MVKYRQQNNVSSYPRDSGNKLLIDLAAIFPPLHSSYPLLCNKSGLLSCRRNSSVVAQEFYWGGSCVAFKDTPMPWLPEVTG